MAPALRIARRALARVRPLPTTLATPSSDAHQRMARQATRLPPTTPTWPLLSDPKLMLLRSPPQPPTTRFGHYARRAQGTSHDTRRRASGPALRRPRLLPTIASARRNRLGDFPLRHPLDARHALLRRPTHHVSVTRARHFARHAPTRIWHRPATPATPSDDCERSPQQAWLFPPTTPARRPPRPPTTPTAPSLGAC